jgi:hypothetical protein
MSDYSIYFVFTYFLKKPKSFHSQSINILYEYINKDMDRYNKIKNLDHFVSWTYGAYVIVHHLKDISVETQIEEWLSCIGKMYRGYEIEFVKHATKYEDLLNFEISEF